MIRSLPAVMLAAGLHAAMGRTEPRIELITPQPPKSTAVLPLMADVDGDGDLDIVIPADTSETSSNAAITVDTWLENLGDRSFADPRPIHLARRGPEVFDAAGKLADADPSPGVEWLVVETDRRIFENFTEASRPVAIVFNKTGPGGRIPLTPLSPSTWLPVDLDGDSSVELLEIRDNGNARYLTIWERSIEGVFQPLHTQVFDESLPTYLPDIRAVDVDGDGDRDLVSVTDSYGYFLERTGPREFSPVVHWHSFNLVNPVFADLDGDDIPEIVSVAERRLAWYAKGEGFTYERHESPDLLPGYDISQRVWRIIPGAGEPARLILLTTDESHTPVVAEFRTDNWESISSRSFDASGLISYFSTTNYQGLEDLDGDGRLDVVVQTYVNSQHGSGMGRLAVAWGGEDGFSPVEFVAPAPASWNDPLILDVENDGDMDVIFGPDTDGDYHLLINDGTGRFGVKALAEIRPGQAGAPAGTQITGLSVADLNGDGLPDLVVDYQSGHWFNHKRAAGIARNDGDGTFTVLPFPDGAFDTLSLHRPFAGAEFVDWDGDGDLDAVVEGCWHENIGGELSYHRRQLTSGAIVADFFGNPVRIVRTCTGDLDGDGVPDIASFVYRANTDGFIFTGVSMAVSYGDGSGGIATIAEVPANLYGMDIYGNPTDAGEAAFLDVNADGHLDLVTYEIEGIDFYGNPDVYAYWRRNPGGGSREPASWVKLPLPSFPRPPLLDFDADGQPEWVHPTGFLKPTLLGPLASAQYDFTGSSGLAGARHLGSADFDGDGDADFLVGNRANVYLVRNLVVDERSSLERWMQARGAGGALGEPDADADGDGRSNEQEIIEGTNPLVADAAAPENFRLSLAMSGGVPVLGFQQRADAADWQLHYRIESSDDCVVWEEVDSSGAELLLLGGGWAHLSLAPEAGEGRRFFRMKAWHRPAGH